MADRSPIHASTPLPDSGNPPFCAHQFLFLDHPNSDHPLLSDLQSMASLELQLQNCCRNSSDPPEFWSCLTQLSPPDHPQEILSQPTKFCRKKSTSLDDVMLQKFKFQELRILRLRSDGSKIAKDDSFLPLLSESGEEEGFKDVLLIKSSNLGAELEQNEELKAPTTCHVRCLSRQMHSREVSQVSEISFDLMGSQGAKFLLQINSAEDAESPFRACAAVPFKWELAPGQPKPEAFAPKKAANPSLQLPPRLLLRNISSGCLESSNSTPDLHKKARRSKTLSRFALPDPKEKPFFSKSHSTSPVFTPDFENSGSCSSSETNPSSESETQTKNSHALLISDAESACFSQPRSASHSKSGLATPIVQECGIKDAVSRSFGKFRAKLHRKKAKETRIAAGVSETLIWAPTLATYFQCFEDNTSGQLVLLETDKTNSSRNSNSFKVSITETKSDAEIQNASHCSCSCHSNSTQICFSPSGQFKQLKKNPSKQRRWVARRIRKGSRLLTFVFKALKQAVAPKSRSAQKSEDESGAVYHCI